MAQKKKAPWWLNESQGLHHRDRHYSLCPCSQQMVSIPAGKYPIRPARSESYRTLLGGVCDGPKLRRSRAGIIKEKGFNSMVFTKTLVERLEKIIRTQKRSQIALAKLIGCRPETLNRWLKRKKAMSHAYHAHALKVVEYYEKYPKKA